MIALDHEWKCACQPKASVVGAGLRYSNHNGISARPMHLAILIINFSEFQDAQYMDDMFFHEINTKLVFAVLIAIGGVMFVIRRLIVSAAEKGKHLKMIKEIKRRPDYAHDVADELDIPYGSKSPFSFEYFEKLKTYIRSHDVIAEYRIVYTADVNNAALLVFTAVSFLDFDVGMTGRGTDVQKTSYIVFLLTYHHQDRTLSVQSDLYHTSIEKFQREGFLKAVFEGGSW